jgi:hypothetical protein
VSPTQFIGMDLYDLKINKTQETKWMAQNVNNNTSLRDIAVIGTTGHSPPDFLKSSLKQDHYLLAYTVFLFEFI